MDVMLVYERSIEDKYQTTGDAELTDLSQWLSYKPKCKTVKVNQLVKTRLQRSKTFDMNMMNMKRSEF